VDELQISRFYYFDTIPLHPQPEHLESLLSYVMRISEANGIYEILTLYKLMEIRIGNVNHFGDYSLQFFKKFALRTTCSETRLLATTLHFAGEKFGRSTKSNALSRFFHGSLSEYLRYCPLCLSNSMYYPLTWRFLALTGCHIHHCRLLDHCGNCGQYIPLFAIPSRVGVCPLCKKELYLYPAEMLSKQEGKLVEQRITDLEHLLSPQGWEEGDEIARIIGWRFKKFREMRQYSVQQTAEALLESVITIRHLERGTKEKKSPFQLYLRYADYLNITLQEIFTCAFYPPTKYRQNKKAEQKRFASSKKEDQTSRQKRECELLELVQKTIQDYRNLEVPFTISTLCKQVHMTLPNLKMYPSIKSLLEEVSNNLREEKRKRRQKLEDDMIEQVEQAVLYLRSCGKNISEKTIGEYLHRSTGQLRRHPRVNTILKRTLGKSKASSGKPCQEDEDLVIDRVCRAITDLKA
jgi:transcriptional regulator with XRE-family HTH domain